MAHSSTCITGTAAHTAMIGRDDFVTLECSAQIPDDEITCHESEKIGSSENVSPGEQAQVSGERRRGTASDRRVIYTIDIDFAEVTSISVLEADDSPRDSPQCSPRCIERKKRNDDDGRIHRRLPIKGSFTL